MRPTAPRESGRWWRAGPRATGRLAVRTALTAPPGASRKGRWRWPPRPAAVPTLHGRSLGPGACPGGPPRASRARAAAHLQLVYVRDPEPVHQLVAVLLGEVAHVGDEGGDQQHVPTQRDALAPEVLHRLRPADVFRRQAPHQPETGARGPGVTRAPDGGARGAPASDAPRPESARTRGQCAWALWGSERQRARDASPRSPRHGASSFLCYRHRFHLLLCVLGQRPGSVRGQSGSQDSAHVRRPWKPAPNGTARHRGLRRISARDEPPWTQRPGGSGLLGMLRCERSRSLKATEHAGATGKRHCSRRWGRGPAVSRCPSPRASGLS